MIAKNNGGYLEMHHADGGEVAIIPGNILQAVKEHLAEMSDEEIAEISADWDAAPKSFTEMERTLPFGESLHDLIEVRHPYQDALDAMHDDR